MKCQEEIFLFTVIPEILLQKLARNLMADLSRIDYLLNVLKNMYLVMGFERMLLILFKFWGKWMEMDVVLGSNWCVKGTSNELTRFTNHKLLPCGLNVE